MSEVWVPVVFAAIIVLGAVGGQLAHTVLKRVLPLLETLVAERQKGLSSSDVTDLRNEISGLQRRIAGLEVDDQRLESLEAQVGFLQSLLEERGTEERLRAGDED